MWCGGYADANITNVLKNLDEKNAELKTTLQVVCREGYFLLPFNE
jgi:hypothetical protein